MKQSAGPAVTHPRAVLDTNVVISALLFDGSTSRLVDLWQTNRFVFLISRAIVTEYLIAMSYKKFGFSDQEIHFLLEEQILPFAEVVKEIPRLNIPSLKDKSDHKFVECAVAGRADFLVTGDAALLRLKNMRDCQIIPPNLFLKTG